MENLGRWGLYPPLPPFFTRDGGSLQKCSLGRRICEWPLVCYCTLTPVCLCDYTSEFFMFTHKGNYYLLSTYCGLALYMWSVLKALGHRGVTQFSVENTKMTKMQQSRELSDVSGATLRALRLQILFSTISSSGTGYVKFTCLCLSFCPWLIGLVGRECLQNGLVNRTVTSGLHKHTLLVW